MSTTSPTRPIPASPSLDHLKHQAKDLAKAVRTGNKAALKRISTLFSPSPETFRLHNAQFVIASEYGFPSWTKLKVYVESVSGGRASRLRPYRLDVTPYEERAEGLVSVHEAGLPMALDEIRKYHPNFSQASDEAVQPLSWPSWQVSGMTSPTLGSVPLCTSVARLPAVVVPSGRSWCWQLLRRSGSEKYVHGLWRTA